MDRYTFGAWVPQLESVDTTPAGLVVEANSLAEDGYNALFGDWATLRSRQMFKMPAEHLGVAFPCATRESLLACVEGLGDVGRTMLQLGAHLKSNIDQYGFKGVAEWRKEHWGIETDFSEPVIRLADDELHIAICSPAIVIKTFALYSTPYAELTFDICSMNESGRRPERFLMKKGKRTRNENDSDREIAPLIWGFRRSVGARWLDDAVASTIWARHLEMNQRGRAIFRETQVAVDFALYRVRQGETERDLGRRFPELNDDHIRALESLASGEHRNGLRIVLKEV